MDCFQLRKAKVAFGHISGLTTTTPSNTIVGNALKSIFVAPTTEMCCSDLDDRLNVTLYHSLIWTSKSLLKCKVTKTCKNTLTVGKERIWKFHYGKITVLFVRCYRIILPQLFSVSTVNQQQNCLNSDFIDYQRLWHAIFAPLWRSLGRLFRICGRCRRMRISRAGRCGGRTQRRKGRGRALKNIFFTFPNKIKRMTKSSTH